MSGAPKTSRPRPTFRPRFTIGIVYLVAFFVIISFLQVLPALLDLLSELPPGPAQEKAAEEIMRKGSNPLISLVLSLAATSLGSYFQILPGMREG
jgi:hypothetical protein